MLAPFSSASLSGGRKLPALFIHQHACIQLNQTVCESAARLTLLHASVPKLSSKLERRHTQAMHACTWLPSSRASSVPAEKGSCRSRVLWPVHGRESSFWGGRARPGLFAFFISMPGLPCIAVAATCVLLPTGDRSRDGAYSTVTQVTRDGCTAHTHTRSHHLDGRRRRPHFCSQDQRQLLLLYGFWTFSSTFTRSSQRSLAFASACSCMRCLLAPDAHPVLFISLSRSMCIYAMPRWYLVRHCCIVVVVVFTTGMVGLLSASICMVLRAWEREGEGERLLACATDRQETWRHRTGGLSLSLNPSRLFIRFLSSSSSS